MGKRNYNKKLTENQLIWLKNDLATITDKSRPVFVAMHAQLYANPTSLPQVSSISMSGGTTLVNYLKELPTPTSLPAIPISTTPSPPATASSSTT